MHKSKAQILDIEIVVSTGSLLERGTVLDSELKLRFEASVRLSRALSSICHWTEDLMARCSKLLLW